MTLTEYIRDIRIRTDDNPVGINPYHSDTNLAVFINNARKKIAFELQNYENRHFVDLELYVDSYDLPSDFISADMLIDVYNQVEQTPDNKGNIETSRQQFQGLPVWYSMFYINEVDKSLVFSQTITSSMIEPTYTIKSFSRSGKTIVIDASTGTLSDIGKWDRVKPYIKVYNAGGSIEYMRVSKILQTSTSPEEWTLYLSNYDLKNEYKNNVLGTGTVAIASSTITGTSTLFNTELDVNERIVVNGTSYTVTARTSNTAGAISGTASVSATTAYYIDNKVTFVDGDSLRIMPYVMYYNSLPKELEMYNEQDRLPIDCQQKLVPLLSAYEAWLRRSRIDLANATLNEYKMELDIVRAKVNQEAADLHNKAKAKNTNSGWY